MWSDRARSVRSSPVSLTSPSTYVLKPSHSFLLAGLSRLPAIDTAQGYFTEQVTGEVVAEANRPRSSIWLTTKRTFAIPFQSSHSIYGPYLKLKLHFHVLLDSLSASR